MSVPVQYVTYVLENDIIGANKACVNSIWQTHQGPAGARPDNKQSNTEGHVLGQCSSCSLCATRILCQCRWHTRLMWCLQRCRRNIGPKLKTKTTNYNKQCLGFSTQPSDLLHTIPNHDLLTLPTKTAYAHFNLGRQQLQLSNVRQ